jgi:hypothetical protein
MKNWHKGEPVTSWNAKAIAAQRQQLDDVYVVAYLVATWFLLNANQNFYYSNVRSWDDCQ